MLKMFHVRLIPIIFAFLRKLPPIQLNCWGILHRCPFHINELHFLHHFSNAYLASFRRSFNVFPQVPSFFFVCNEQFYRTKYPLLLVNAIVFAKLISYSHFSQTKMAFKKGILHEHSIEISNNSFLWSFPFEQNVQVDVTSKSK